MNTPSWIFKILELYDNGIIDESDSPMAVSRLNGLWNAYALEHKKQIKETKAFWLPELLDFEHNQHLLTILKDMVTEKRYAQMDLTPEKPKFKSITQAMYWLFSTKNPCDVTIEEATKIAREVKPNTRFNKWHLYFHRKNYRMVQMAKLAYRVGTDDEN